MRLELLTALAETHGTPLFAYDLARIRERLAQTRRAFGPGVELYYAVKANPSLAAPLAAHVDGFDVASRGELALARAHKDDARISFAGPGKTAAELAAIGGATLVAESLEELEEAPRDTPVLLRLNPAARVRAFAVSTAGGPSPFGIDAEELPRALELRPDARGIHVHAGSQCLSARAYLEHLAQTLDLAAAMAKHTPVERVCFGGGLGWAPDRAIDVAQVGLGLSRALDAWSAALGARRPLASLELGRYLVAGAGSYVARVVRVKRSRGERYAVLDGGMNHFLLATGLLGNPPLPMRTSASRAALPQTIVGPLCTPLDTLARRATLPELERGDLVIFDGAGAYGATLSPGRFLGHAPAKELLIDGDDVSVLSTDRVECSTWST